ncbi:hypothetical protein [Clostridium perfringens]|uniref:Uncharacterized protein n=1 Tax=Clostridium perfringens TaxID=1502 RepID=A0A140GR58_CLOPF|nr:hypothetical protein [Clostridium perfringens]AMN31017.1 hypothetical protein JFP838_pA0101 [Clostridium perfringens]
MNKILKNIKNSRGYVSIETLIVAGLIIGFGAFFIAKFVKSGKTVGTQAISHVTEAQTSMDSTITAVTQDESSHQ